MYLGLKQELINIILSQNFNIKRQEIADTNTTSVAYIISKDKSIVATLEKTTKYRTQHTDDSEFGGSFKMYDTDYYTFNIDGVSFKPNNTDKCDFAELFNLCDARNNFEAVPNNATILSFLARQQQK